MLSLLTKERKVKFSKPLKYSTFSLSYVDIESTDTFFSDLENECKLLGTKPKQIAKTFLYSRLLKKLEENKLKKYDEKI